MRKRNVKNAILKTIAFVSATAMLSTSFSTISFAKEVPDDTETSDSAYSKVVESDLTEDIALDEIEEVAAAEVDDAEIESSTETEAETAEEVDAEDAEAEEVEAEDVEAEDAETDEVDAEEAEAEDAEDAEDDDVEAEDAEDAEADDAEAEDAEDAETEEIDVVEEADEVDAEDAEDAESAETDAEEIDATDIDTDAEEAEEIDTEEEVSIANELDTVKNGWEKQSDGSYKYYENGTAVSNKVIKIGNDYFGFDSNGIMYDDALFYLNDGQGNVAYRAKKGGYLYVNSWYETPSGDKYYYGAGGRANVGLAVLTIDGVNYLFYSGGRLNRNGRGTINDVLYASDKEGKAYELKKGGWTKVGIIWYYLYEDGSYRTNTVFRDGGKYYYWTNYGRVLCDDYTTYNGYVYRAKGDCSLYVNEWYTNEYGDKYYYGENGKASTRACVQTIGGKQYLFDGYGRLYMGGSLTVDGENYISDENGIATKVTKDGWVQAGKYWHYYENGKAITDKIKKIGSFYFGFDYSGNMYANTTFNGSRYDESGKYLGNGYFYADAEGHLYINKWKLDNGEWRYFGADGARVLGWQTIAGTKYYFNPVIFDATMMRSCYVLDGNDIYRLGSDGVAKKITNPNGLFYDVYENFAVYYQNGTLVKSTWKEINGKWFYFEASGSPIQGEVRFIKDAYFAFNADGTMATKGWFKIDNHTYYVKNDKGYLATGEQQIGDKYYYFYDDGQMRTGIINYNNKIYFLNPDGSWAATAKEGWNSVQGTWYYVKNGTLIYGQELELADGTYYFDNNGAMVKNYIRNHKYFGADGKKVTKDGWYKLDTNWIYIRNGSMLYDGVKTINKTEYAFNYEGFMVSNGWYDGVYYNADGIAVKKSTIKDGWQLYGGRYYYLKNGSAVRRTWVGNYYIGSAGFMMTNQRTPDNYFVGKDGRYVTNTVIKGMVVKSNGKIACNEFVTIGGKKYYANEDGYTCPYGAYVIGKNLYQFKTTYVDGYPVGEYVKTIATNVQNNKWYQFGNQWAYVRDGQVILNGTAEIGGANYYFSNGVMMTNYMADASVKESNYFGYDQNSRVAYFGSDGKEVKNRSGWVDGYYYGADHRTTMGWVQVNGNLYYGYSDSGRSEYTVISGKIYQLDTKTGALKNNVTKYNGWLQAGSDWYYFENGFAVTDIKTIGKATYAFDYDGRMLKNCLIETKNGDRYYVNSQGIIDTTPGFRTVDGKLYYFDKDGKALMGIHEINGKMYYFESSRNDYYSNY